jgi:hypothetical protein
MVQFLRFVERGRWDGLVLAILLWTISIETYQAIWFAFVPVTFAVLLAVYDQAQPRNRALVLASVLLVVQIGSLVDTALTTPKVRNPNALGAFAANVRNIWLIHFDFRRWHGYGDPGFMRMVAPPQATCSAAWGKGRRLA